MKKYKYRPHDTFYDTATNKIVIINNNVFYEKFYFDENGKYLRDCDKCVKCKRYNYCKGTPDSIWEKVLAKLGLDKLGDFIDVKDDYNEIDDVCEMSFINRNEEYQKINMIYRSNYLRIRKGDEYVGEIRKREESKSTNPFDN